MLPNNMLPPTPKASRRAGTHSTSPIRKNVSIALPIRRKPPMGDLIAGATKLSPQKRFDGVDAALGEVRKQGTLEGSWEEQVDRADGQYKKKNESVVERLEPEPNRFRRASIKSAFPSRRSSVGRSSFKDTLLETKDKKKWPFGFGYIERQCGGAKKYLEPSSLLQHWQAGNYPNALRLTRTERESKRRLQEAEQFWRDTEIRKFLEDQEKAQEFEVSILEH